MRWRRWWFLWLLFLTACHSDAPADAPKPAHQVNQAIQAKPASQAAALPARLPSWQQNGVPVYYFHNNAPAQITLMFRAGSAYGKAPAVAYLSLRMLQTTLAPAVKTRLGREFAYITLDASALLQLDALIATLNEPPLSRAAVNAEKKAFDSPPDAIAHFFYQARFARSQSPSSADLDAVLRLQVRRFWAKYYQRDNLKLVITGNIPRAPAQQASQKIASQLRAGGAVHQLVPIWQQSPPSAWQGVALQPVLLAATQAPAQNLTQLGALYRFASTLGALNADVQWEQQGMRLLLGVAWQNRAALLHIGSRARQTYWQNWFGKTLAAVQKNPHPQVSHELLLMAAGNDWSAADLAAFYQGFSQDALEIASAWQQRAGLWQLQAR